MKSLLILICITLSSFPAYGGANPLIIVSNFSTLQRHSKKKADYATLPITLTNDRSDTKMKYGELKKSLQLLEKRIEKEPGITLYRGPVFQATHGYSKFSFSTSGKKSRLSM